MVCYVTNLMVSHHPAKSGDHRHCNSGDMIVLFCQVILQDHVNKGTSNFMVARFGGYKHCGSGDIMVLV